MINFMKLLSLVMILSLLLSSLPTFAASNPLRAEGLNAFKAKAYPKAVNSFYKWSRQEKVLSERQEAKFYLGMALAKLDILQVGTFPLVDVVRSGQGKFRKSALNQMAIFANQLDEKALLKFTLEKLGPDELTELSKSTFYLSMSEIAHDEGQRENAFNWAQKSFEANPKNDEALYQMGYLSLEKEKYSEALAYFSQLFEKYKDKSPSDKRRGIITMNVGRVYYQMKDWGRAAEYYRQVSKDHPDYRTAMQELSWALLRGAQLRSALSPIQSLLTPFYSQFFDPETFVLSSSIYIFSCQYDDALLNANAFEKNYLPLIDQLDNWLKGQRSIDDLYSELVAAQKSLEFLNKTGRIESQGQLPFFVMRTILTEPDIQAGIKYLKRLDMESTKLSQNFTESPFLQYGQKILKGRTLATKRALAKAVESYLRTYLGRTIDLSDQIGFIKYEALNGQRLQIKDKLRVGAELSLDKDVSREYYAQNGYRYWPFDGEFWRDEIGSFQYVGINRCEK